LRPFFPYFFPALWKHKNNLNVKSKYSVRSQFIGALLATLLLVTALAACATPTPIPATPTSTPRPTDLGANLVTKPTYPSLTYGIQAFMWWNPTMRSLDLEHIRLMNFGAVKQIFAWAAIQPNKGDAEDWSHADDLVKEVNYRNLKLIVRIDSIPAWALDQTGALPLNLTAWGNFCHDLAARYAGKIAGYQVLNEPNLGREWFGRTPNASDYVTTLKTCAAQLKVADPGAIVISAGLAPTGTTSDQAIPDTLFLQQMFTAGLSSAYDVLGVHAPGYKSAPETDPADPALDGQRWQVFRHVEDMRAIQVANGDGAKQIAILEMGWTLDTVHKDYGWFAVTEAQQAQYLVGAYRYAATHWRPWIGLMITIYLPDITWTTADEQYWWSIALPGYNGPVRQAFIDLSNMEKVTGDTVIPSRLPGTSNQVYTPMPSQ
jgi:hypothetical protein